VTACRNAADPFVSHAPAIQCAIQNCRAKRITAILCMDSVRWASTKVSSLPASANPTTFDGLELFGDLYQRLFAEYASTYPAIAPRYTWDPSPAAPSDDAGNTHQISQKLHNRFSMVGGFNHGPSL
jgi:hypothetical protein